MNKKRFINETLSSKILYKGKLVNIRKDIVKSEKSQFSREIVEHRGAVAIVPVIGNSIVMVKQFRHGAKKDMLELPAGTLEKNENPNDCAKRELAEETGYNAGSLRKLLEFYVAPGYNTEVIHVYLATDLTISVQQLEKDKDEDIDVLEINVDGLLRMIEKNEITDAKSIAGILYYHNFIKTI